MAATSKHWGDIKLWIDKVIDSCETTAQTESVRRLIKNFQDTYGDKCSSSVFMLLRGHNDSRFYYLLEKERPNLNIKVN